MFFRVNVAGFCLQLLNQCAATMEIVSQSRDAQKVIQKTGKILVGINFVFLNVVTYCRYCHHGKVCSGDYKFEDVEDLEYEIRGYVNVEGTFLASFVIAQWI